MGIRSVRVGVPSSGPPAFEFSTLLKLTEAVKIYVHASCT